MDFTYITLKLKLNGDRGLIYLCVPVEYGKSTLLD
jgi:hypothetical protein